MTARLESVAELIRGRTGLSIKPATLNAALQRLDLGAVAAGSLLAAPDTSAGAALLERLIDEVSNKETFFLRQRAELETIDWRSLAARARLAGRHKTRVWVAACATGEEVYTLAMLADGVSAPAAPSVSIHASDLSGSALSVARDGRYGQRSTRMLDASLIKRYFTRDGTDLVVGERLRGMVSFSRQNLVADRPASGGPFDLVVCRNVLIYFDLVTVQRVVASLTRALSPHGRLLLGAADRLCCSASQLARSTVAPPPPPPSTPPPPGRRPDSLPLLPRSAPALLPSELDRALQAADRGDLDQALRIATTVLRDDRLSAEAYFICGLAYRGLDRPGEAGRAFRSALYVDPGFGLAAFAMGRASEACGDTAAAVRAYKQALEGLNGATRRSDFLHLRVDEGDIAAACAIRLRALRGSAARMPPFTRAG